MTTSLTDIDFLADMCDQDQNVAQVFNQTRSDGKLLEQRLKALRLQVEEEKNKLDEQKSKLAFVHQLLANPPDTDDFKEFLNKVRMTSLIFLDIHPPGEPNVTFKTTEQLRSIVGIKDVKWIKFISPSKIVLTISERDTFVVKVRDEICTDKTHNIYDGSMLIAVAVEKKWLCQYNPDEENTWLVQGENGKMEKSSGPTVLNEHTHITLQFRAPNGVFTMLPVVNCSTSLELDQADTIKITRDTTSNISISSEANPDKPSEHIFTLNIQSTVRGNQQVVNHFVKRFTIIKCADWDETQFHLFNRFAVQVPSDRQIATADGVSGVVNVTRNGQLIVGDEEWSEIIAVKIADKHNNLLDLWYYVSTFPRVADISNERMEIYNGILLELADTYQVSMLIF